MIDLNYFLQKKRIDIPIPVIYNFEKVCVCEVQSENSFFFLYSFIITRMMLSIVESKRNKPALLLDNFRYLQDKMLSTTIY